MTKRILIDTAHSEELRVAVVDEKGKIEDFEVETSGKQQVKGNIYVATVSRVEPSLQAAFITYGAEKNGFLAFNEVHPSFFDVPAKEQKELIKELEEVAERRRKEVEEAAEARAAQRGNRKSNNDDDDDENDNITDAEADEDARALAKATALADKAEGKANAKEEKAERKEPIHRRYKIEEVLKEGQKILIQVTKEERGTKGAALTTYVSMPGRFTVLMPNTPYAGGVSRKIHSAEDRKPLKEILDGLKIPKDMGLIVRTAGVGKTKDQIKKDFKNLTSLWAKINKSFSNNTVANECVHEEGTLIVRALRDMMGDEVEEIIVAGEHGYAQAKDYAKALMPDVAKVLKQHKSPTPIFVEYGIEQELNQMHRTQVVLPSGGYLVINPTEALVSIDINSGRATQAGNLEETAFRTNLEAAEEIARQLRLRDLAGLIVIDFIDMEDRRNERAIVKAMRKAIRRDRARIQVGEISNFGLMEVSRQRLRPSFVESTRITCPTCNGTGGVHSLASAALMVLRGLESDKIRGNADKIVIHTSAELAVYILNHKRGMIADLEANHKFQILLHADDHYIAPDHKLELIRVKADGSESKETVEVKIRETLEKPSDNKGKGRRGNKQTRTRGGRKEGAPQRNRDDQNEDREDNKNQNRRPNKQRNDNRDEAKNEPRHNNNNRNNEERGKQSKRRPTRTPRPQENTVENKVETKPEAKPAQQQAKPQPKPEAPKKIKETGVVVQRIGEDGKAVASADESIGKAIKSWWAK